MHELEAEYWERVDFIYLDREDPANADVVRQFGVTYQPVIVLLAADGTEFEHWFHFSRDQTRMALDAHLAAMGG